MYKKKNYYSNSSKRKHNGTYECKVRKDLGTSTYLYGNGYIISYDKSRPKKYRWQVKDTNYFSAVTYASDTLKDCKTFCDNDY